MSRPNEAAAVVAHVPLHRGEEGEKFPLEPVPGL